MRWVLTCVLTLLAVGNPAAPAHGADPTTENLLRRGLEQLRRAEQAWVAGDRDLSRRYGREAEGMFRAALDQSPRERQAALLAGQAAAFAEDPRRAAGWAERYRALSPYGDRDPDLHYLQALIAVRASRRPDRAIHHLRRMRALNPNVRAAQRDLLMYVALDEHGWQLVKQDEYERAARQFLTAERIARRLGHASKAKSARANYAICLQRANRPAEAEVIFRELQAAEPEDALWHLHLALCLAYQNKFEEAVPSYAKAIELHRPGSYRPAFEAEFRRAHLRMGNCLRNAGIRNPDPARRQRLLDRARASLETYIELEPEDALGHRWMGTLLYEDEEKPYEALPYFVRAHELDPHCVDPLRAMIQIRGALPPPPGTADTPEALAAWRAPVAAWKKDLEEGAERRRAVLDKRSRETGFDGCM